MISTKWVQGSDLNEIFTLRNLVFRNELGFGDEFIYDEFDSFGKNVMLYDGEKFVGAGRLIFNNGQYIVDKICVLEKFRNQSYGELIIRMLVRKAVTIGAKETYAYVQPEYESLFEKIGFINTKKSLDNGLLQMVKTGDVGGNCKH